jgi:hypothetical protein
LIGERGNDTVNGGDGTDTCDGETETGCELDPQPARNLRLIREKYTALAGVILIN